MVNNGIITEDTLHGVLGLIETDNFPSKKLESKIEPTMLTLTDREIGKLCRQALAKNLYESWGKLKMDGIWLTSLNNNNIIALYSNLNKDRWFYGMKMKDYNKLRNNNIVLLMRDDNNCSYVLLDPNESNYLISKISPAKDNSKKINVRIPSFGKTYIQEWPEFKFENRIVSIGIIDLKER